MLSKFSLWGGRPAQASGPMLHDQPMGPGRANAGRPASALLLLLVCAAPALGAQEDEIRRLCDAYRKAIGISYAAMAEFHEAMVVGRMSWGEAREIHQEALSAPFETRRQLLSAALGGTGVMQVKTGEQVGIFRTIGVYQPARAAIKLAYEAALAAIRDMEALVQGRSRDEVVDILTQSVVPLVAAFDAWREMEKAGHEAILVALCD